MVRGRRAWLGRVAPMASVNKISESEREGFFSDMDVQNLKLERIKESEVDMADLVKSVNEMYLDLSEEQIGKLVKYLDLMFKWNDTYNLTAVKEFEIAWPIHILDSLSLCATIKDFERIIDVGSGPGLPGIPLAIAFPEKKFTLLDSKQKKTAFLESVKNEFNLENVEVVTHRVESFFGEEPWDAVVTRAFAQLQDVVNLTRHLVKDNGSIICMKGVYPFEEINMLTTKRYGVVKTHVPRLNHDRHIVTIEVSEKNL